MVDQRSKKGRTHPLLEVGRDLFTRRPRRAYVPLKRPQSWRVRLLGWIRHKHTARGAGIGAVFLVVVFGVWVFVGPSDQVLNGGMTLTLIPPTYTGISPVVLISPTGADSAGGFIEVPEGTQMEATLGPKMVAPELELDGQRVAFTPTDDGGAMATAPIGRGQVLNTATLSVKRGWRALGTWRLRVMADDAPRIAFADTPVPTLQKTIRVAFEAEDDHGVHAMAVHVRSLTDKDPVESVVPISALDLKRIRRVMFADLTWFPGAGGRAEVWLTATDGAGQTTATDKRVVVLPTRDFTNPLARALIEERSRLIKNGDQEDVRSDVAGIMAGIARQQGRRDMDLALLMLLRAGAVRLILNPEIAARQEVAAILWQIATRMDDGPLGRAQEVLRESERELADALDDGAEQGEVLARVDRIQNILTHYMDEVLAERAPAAAGSNNDFVLQSDKAFLTREDLYSMIEALRGQALTGAYDTARRMLEKVQDTLEGLHAVAPTLTPVQKQLLQQASSVRAFARAQKRLRDQTFLLMRGEGGTAPAGLKDRVADQQKQLGTKIGAQTWEDAGAASLLKDAIHTMESAQKAVVAGGFKKAYALQSEAFDVLRRASDAMTAAAGGLVVADPVSPPAQTP